MTDWAWGGVSVKSCQGRGVTELSLDKLNVLTMVYEQGCKSMTKLVNMDSAKPDSFGN